MNIDINVEGIAKDATEEASKIAAKETAKTTDGVTAKTATAEADRSIAEEAAKETVEATGSTPAPGAPSAVMAMETRAADETMAAADIHPSTPEEPPSSKYLRVGDLHFISFLGMSSTQAYTGEETLDGEVATTESGTMEGWRDCSDAAKEHDILMAMNESFKKLQAHLSSREECVDRREAILAKAEEDF